MPTPWDNLPNTNINTTTQKPKIPLIAICLPVKTLPEDEFIEKVEPRLRYVPVDFANKMFFKSKSPSLPVARDALVTSALSVNADYLFFVDSDNIFEIPEDPNIALKQLYECINKDPNSKDAKIVSGLYRAKKKEGFDYAAWLKVLDAKIGYIPIQSYTGNWINVSVIGMGCCLIDMNVFREVPRPWFKWNTFEELSEDFYFFDLAKEYGYNVKVLTDVKLSHIGKLKVKCDGTITTAEM